MRPLTRTLVRALTWLLTPALMAGTLVCESLRDDASSGLGSADLAFTAGLAASWLVGVVLTVRAPQQRVGWAFLGLASAVAWSAFSDGYADLGLPGGRDVPGSHLLATFGDSSFVWWFVFLALVVQWTPPDRSERGPVARLPVLTLGTGALFQVMALVRSTPLDPPREHLSSPWAIGAVSGPAAFLAAVAIYALGVEVLASVVLLVRAWRVAEGEVRQQLLWLVAGAVPVAPCVVAAFAFSGAGHDNLAALVLGAAMVTLVSGAALSVLRYRLYDVERVVTDSAAWAIASAAVVLVYLVVVVVISRSTPINSRSHLPAVAATLAGVGAARVSYLWGRRAVSRRVNRTRFDTLEAVRQGLTASTDLDTLLTEVLGPGCQVLYPAPGGAWVTTAGIAVEPQGEFVAVHRHGVVAARIEYDGGTNDRTIVEAVAREIAAEIDNVALRAELSRQVELISESRTRLETAHLDERRRIERDLHDGAQQRLLATALQLQSARVNGAESVLRDEVDRAIVDLTATVQELRSLAAGVQPAALAAGGLLAAVVDLVARIPAEIRYDVVDRRFPPPVESAAWFVIAEGVANAVKHAGVRDLVITVASDPASLRVCVEDLGTGRADATGRGLQGLADRVSALRGDLWVSEIQPHGTRVEAVLPCGS